MCRHCPSVCVSPLLVVMTTNTYISKSSTGGKLAYSVDRRYNDVFVQKLESLVQKILTISIQTYV